MIYTHHEYDINVKQCANDINNQVDQNSVSNFEISEEEFNRILLTAVKSYENSVGITEKMDNFEKSNAYYISPTHPSFDYWLALKLSITEVNYIPLILDHFFESFIFPYNFIGHIEFIVLNIIKKNVIHDYTPQEERIILWIRDKKKDLKLNENFTNENQSNKDEVKSFDYQKVDEMESFDDRLKTDQDQNEILNYFYLLNVSIGVKQPVILSKEEIEIFVQSNFHGFDRKERKLLNPTIGRSVLRSFIYDFYLIYDLNKYDNKQKDYCQLLINNFTEFNKHNIKSLSSNLAKPYPNKYPFEKRR